MTDFLDEKHREITNRLKELKPLVDEFNRLQDAASALAKVIGSAASEATSAAAATVTGRRRRGRPRGSSSAKRASKATPAATAAATPAATPIKATPKKRGRPPGRKKGGKRARQAQALIRANPGITVTEMAKKMGINGTYLYKVLPPLEQAGKIRKEGRGWYPTEG